MEKQEHHQLPVINLRKEKMEATGGWISACHDVRRALETYGCFVAVVYADDDEVVSTWSEVRNQTFGAFKELFDLPLDTKERNPSTIPSFAYEVQPDPLVESMGIQDPTNPQYLQTFASLMWPHRGDHHHFCENLHSYLKTLSGVGAMVATMVFESYGVVEKHSDSSQVGSGVNFLFRVMKYGVAEPNNDDESCKAHTDLNLITVLDQNHVDGLEFQTKAGNHWIPARFPPSSFVIIAGDALRAWSNGRIHAPMHRVMMSGKSPRYSAALFLYSKAKIEAPKDLIDEDNPPKFRALDNLDYLRFFHEQGGQKGDFLKTYCGV